MRIKITSNIDKRVFEVTGDGVSGADTISPDFSSQIEEVRYLRGGGIEPVYRGNDSVDLELSAWKSYPTALECFTEVMDAQAKCPKTGTVEITMVSPGGGQRVRTIAKASISQIRARYLGLRAQFTFRIRGGVVTKPAIGSATY